jgi:hypothetical protein
MTLALGLGLGLSQRGRGGRYSPSILFANGEQGGEYDPSDLTTLFQDAAGTTPVTKNNDTVGLGLDKSKWGGKTLAQVLAGQPNMLPPGAWLMSSAGTAVATESPPGTLNLTGDGVNSAIGDQSFTTVDGVRYWLQADLSMQIAGLFVGTTQGGLNLLAATAGTGARKTFSFIAAGATTWVRFYRTGPGTSIISNIQCRAIPGNHATQATVAKQRAYKTDGTLSWLLDDGSDDALPVTFPNLGANCTVAYASASGVTILTGQTISGAYNLPVTGGNLYGCVIIDRALTPTETQKLTAYLKKKAGL